MFTATLYCDHCKKQISFLEEYYFQSKLQDSLGITNIKKYYQQFGRVYCKNCMREKFKN